MISENKYESDKEESFLTQMQYRRPCLSLHGLSMRRCATPDVVLLAPDKWKHLSLTSSLHEAMSLFAIYDHLMLQYVLKRNNFSCPIIALQPASLKSNFV